MYDTIIIGAGPAGIAASIYAARKKMNALLISSDIGGQINTTWGIENYIGYHFIEGPELIEKFNTQLATYPIEQQIGVKVNGIKKIKNGFSITTDENKTYQAKTLVYATGKKPRKLNVPGEAEYTGKGVTYCATCDGPLFSGKKVAVIGGGNSALEAVLDLSKYAAHIDLISLTQLTADRVLIDKLSDIKDLMIHLEHSVKSIEGEQFVSGLAIENLKTQKTQKVGVAGIFVEIGLVPNSELLKGIVKLNEYGEIPVNCSGETGIEALYAAGDVTDVPEKQIAVAVGEGVKAVLRAHRYLQRLQG
ncbi:MAG TPA: thioredoxin-disulfide reductase [Dehalococcoidia bacterium]|nr:thioredoxin-disulfide reductase [Dehalococcoidia bacterium]